MESVSLKALLEAGCHFGHKADRWHPKAHTFIYQKRDGIHIIDLAKTKSGLEKTAEFLRETGSTGKTALFIGTKRQAAAIIKEQAEKAGAAYLVERWIGGFLTNWEQIHANLEKIRRLKEEETTGGWKKYPKHERVKLGRYVRKLERLYGGVLELRAVPDVLVIIDIKREDVALQEGRNIGAKIIGIVDTNSDPSYVDYVIPANDDAVGSISFLVQYLATAYKEGKEQLVKDTEKAAKAEEKKLKKEAEVKKSEEEKAEKDTKKQNPKK